MRLWRRVRDHKTVYSDTDLFKAMPNMQPQRSTKDLCLDYHYPYQPTLPKNVKLHINDYSDHQKLTRTFASYQPLHFDEHSNQLRQHAQIRDNVNLTPKTTQISSNRFHKNTIVSLLLSISNTPTTHHPQTVASTTPNNNLVYTPYSTNTSPLSHTSTSTTINKFSNQPTFSFIHILPQTAHFQPLLQTLPPHIRNALV